MQIIKYLYSFSFAALSFFFTTTNVVAQTTADYVVPFGGENELIIHRKSGSFSIKYKSTAIINEAGISFLANQKKYTNTDYSNYEIQQRQIKDELGKGIQIKLTAKAPGQPTVNHYFYCYPNREFILTQLEIMDQQLLTSNQLIPLYSEHAQLLHGEDVRTLFVPFDNDTFISYDAKPISLNAQTSAEIGVVFDNQSRHGLVVGSLNHMNWKTGVKTAGQKASIHELEICAGYSDVKVTRDSMAHGAISGKTIQSPKIFVGYFSDWRDGLETYAKAGRSVEAPYIKPWAKATPVGWNSWGVIKEHLSYEQATRVVDFFDKKIPFFRNNDQTAFIDLDSFWDNMVEGGFSGDFSQLKEFVAYCKKRALEPGVYWAPFTDWGFGGDSNRVAEGGNYKFSDMWTKTTKGYHDLDGGRALDPTHPGTQARIAYVINKLKECGFKMIKIDFLAHAAAESSGFFDSTISTGMQAYRVGMECLSDHLANSMLVYAAISPSLATARYAHMRRIACDAWKSIKDTEYTLNSVNYGWWQTYQYDYIDADHLVFEQESEGANRARLIAGLITGSIILGDDYSKPAHWQQRIIKWLQSAEIKSIIQSGKAFRPVEGNTGTKTNPLFIRSDQAGTYLAVFNFDTEATTIHLDTERVGLNPNKTYVFKEVLSGQEMKLNKQMDIAFEKEGAYLYKISAK
ncbi:alpha-galactosidase [Olivibacter sp. SA151]|uniref:alpha-galactosidase n=1 Tax=Olivibacter jilunii TaxID=985016 RepID=UPI003F1767EB